MTVHRVNSSFIASISTHLPHVPWSHVSLSWARSSSSNSRWKQRQGRDAYARDARVQGLKSRAAFKLLEVRRRAAYSLY